MIPGPFSYHRPATLADAVICFRRLAMRPARWPVATAWFR